MERITLFRVMAKLRGRTVLRFKTEPYKLSDFSRGGAGGSDMMLMMTIMTVIMMMLTIKTFLFIETDDVQRKTRTQNFCRPLNFNIEL